MTHKEIRRTFLQFFKERGHTVVESSSLVPKDDPSLLYTSAGMVQFKPLWAGKVPLPYTRAASIQKCLRASDLEEVGRTRKHHTFFEMLGNFSFGDYFKEEAILWAWEYLTQVVRLDPERLYVSVLESDDEAFAIWRDRVGLPSRKIYRLGREDNFWGPAGQTGACGPSSEVYFDMGEEFGCQRPNCQPGCGCDRWVEIWNLVFPQFDQQADGTLLPLKNRGIDTGMGLERLCMVAQGKRSDYETDLFLPLIQRVSRESGQNYRGSQATQEAIQIICDHIRALTFGIADGVIPSNESRGYLLRRILRRALLSARRLGMDEPFLYLLSGEVVELMREVYPELAQKRETIALIIKSEEERFLETLDWGLKILDETVEELKERGGSVLPGEVAFRLYDTYGFPLELTQEIAKGEGISVDLEGFEWEMAQQRARSKGKVVVEEAVKSVEIVGATKFVGYERDEVETEVLSLQELKDGLYEVVLKETPFYAEAGGQVGDRGRIVNEELELEVLDTFKRQDLWISKARAIRGEPRQGAKVKAIVDATRRRELERAHTATHLLHSALRQVLGDYARQEGSLVEPGRLRFDFSSYKPLSQEELAKVEGLVYSKILEDLPVEKFETSIDEAKEMGALAFFGEHYGTRVRVVRIGDFSLELCGGTHLTRTGEVGVFTILSETGVAAGIRRVDALVGENGYRAIKAYCQTLNRLKSSLGVSEELLTRRLDEVLGENRRLEQRVRRLVDQLVLQAAHQLLKEAEVVKGIRLVSGGLDQFEPEELRLVVDRIRAEAQEGVAGLLYTTEGDRIRFLVFSPAELNASALARRVGEVLGGGGGGRPTLAEGSGRDRTKLPRAFEIIRTSIEALPT